MICLPVAAMQLSFLVVPFFPPIPDQLTGPLMLFSFPRLSFRLLFS